MGKKPQNWIKTSLIKKSPSFMLHIEGLYPQLLRNNCLLETWILLKFKIFIQSLRCFTYAKFPNVKHSSCSKVNFLIFRSKAN